MKLSSTNIKKCLVFSQTTAVFIFRKTETLKNYLYFRKWNFLIFQERYNQNRCITEFFCISGKVYSQHWHDSAFLYFNKVIFRTLTHIEQGTYSEPWQMQNLRHIQNTVKTSTMERFASIKSLSTFQQINDSVFKVLHHPSCVRKEVHQQSIAPEGFQKV